MSDLISNLQRLGDADHDDLSVAYDALAEIVRLRILTVEQHDEIERLRQWELVGREWIDKTDWMQSRDAPVRWLGKHRADAMREEIERLTAERDEVRAERDAMRAALNTIARTPAMPFPDPGAHSERAYHEAVFLAWSRSNQTARAALAQIEQEKANGSR